MRESALERRLVRDVERIGGLAPKWVSPGNRGVPDRIILLPGGHIAFVEMKTIGKRLGPLQAKWAETLHNLGHKVYMIDSEDGILGFIDEVSRW